MGPGFFAYLGLTAEQQQQVAALRSAMLEQTSDTRAQLEAKRSEMRALWTVDSPDRDAIVAKHAEMSELREALRIAHVDFKLAVYGLLTAEQRSKLAALPGPGCGWGCRGHGRGMGAGMGPCWNSWE
jgi:Spy/CpxP family protein refolding chaperone